jgi:hypothetical protein
VSRSLPILRLEYGLKLTVRVVNAERILPPLARCRLRRWVDNDAIDGANGRKTLAATRTQFRHDDHVKPVIEDGPELRWTMPQTRIAVDAGGHINPERRVLPFFVSDAIHDAIRSCEAPVARRLPIHGPTVAAGLNQVRTHSYRSRNL